MKNIKFKRYFLLIILSCSINNLFAQLDLVPLYPEPDPRFKSDILLVVAHPDDETAIGSYLAKMIYDENKIISIVYTNRGSGGGNSIGNEQSTAMGLIRETEVRKAVASFGIFNVWFLDGSDTPGQDVFHSLKKLHHGSALEKLIRIVRLTRPEVIITWIPQYSSGENHGDHQASGVVATEAFDLAGDLTVFPTQIAAPRERNDINNFSEGLTVWQPKKIYYFSDRDKSIIADGPKFKITDISQTKNVPYFKLATSLMKPHKVQADVAEIARLADESGDYKKLNNWLGRINIIFGKSLVNCSPNGDMFEGIENNKIKYVPPTYTKEKIEKKILFELGGVFSFYKAFWKRHNVEHLGRLLTPEVAVASGSIMHMPLKIYNNTDQDVLVSVSLEKPEEWEEWAGSAIYKVSAGGIYEKESFISVPYNAEGSKVELTWTAKFENQVINKIKVDVDVYEWVLPQ